MDYLEVRGRTWKRALWNYLPLREAFQKCCFKPHGYAHACIHEHRTACKLINGQIPERNEYLYACIHIFVPAYIYICVHWIGIRAYSQQQVRVCCFGLTDPVQTKLWGVRRQCQSSVGKSAPSIMHVRRSNPC